MFLDNLLKLTETLQVKQKKKKRTTKPKNKKQWDPRGTEVEAPHPEVIKFHSLQF